MFLKLFSFLEQSFSITKALLRVLRGGATFPQIYLAIIFGLAAGMTPGFNFTWLLWLGLLLVLNVNMTIAGVCYLIGGLLKWILAPLTHKLGVGLTEIPSIAQIVSQLADTPYAALFDLEVYSVIGSIPIILVVGGIGGFFLTKTVLKLRVTMLSASESDLAIYIKQHPLLKWLVYALFDKREGISKAYRYDSLFAVSRIFASICVMCVLFLVYMFFIDYAVKSTLKHSISSISGGSEVTISGVDFSLFDGSLFVRYIDVQDPDDPDFNIIHIYRLNADMNMTALLKGQVIFTDMSAQWIKMDMPRNVRGKNTEAERIKKARKPLTLNLGKAATYIDDIYSLSKKINGFIHFFEKYEDDTPVDIKAIESEQKAEEAIDNWLSRRKRLLSDSATQLLPKHPAWILQNIKIGQLEVLSSLPQFSVHIIHLSSHPSLYAEEAKSHVSVDPASLKRFVTRSRHFIEEKGRKHLKHADEWGDEIEKDIIETIKNVF